MMCDQTYVYMLSDYGEYGAENVKITLDKRNLPTMLAQYYERNAKTAWSDAALAELKDKAMHRLETCLTEDAEDLGRGVNLTSGWGGVQLHAVRIWEAVAHNV